MECTWVKCENKAVRQQLDKNGIGWANLCEEHHILLEETLSDRTKVKQMLSYWIKAQGGAQRATDRVIHGV